MSKKSIKKRPLLKGSSLLITSGGAPLPGHPNPVPCPPHRERDLRKMKKYSSYHIQTGGFQQVLVGMAHMVRAVPLDMKCRVIIDYDPALPKVSIETFTDKSRVADLEKSQGQQSIEEARDEALKKFDEFIQKYLDNPSKKKQKKGKATSGRKQPFPVTIKPGMSIILNR